MDLLKYRVEELELRVKHLEREIEAMREKQKEEVRKTASDLKPAEADGSEEVTLMPEKGEKIRKVPAEERRDLKKEGEFSLEESVSQPVNFEGKGEKEGEEVKHSERKEVSVSGGNAEERFTSKAEERMEKDKESLIGKYLIGGLASLLIFIAAASFLAMVWNQISPEVKLGAVSLAGLALTVTGFKMTRKKSR